jgi:hypothetical protein
MSQHASLEQPAVLAEYLPPATRASEPPTMRPEPVRWSPASLVGDSALTLTRGPGQQSTGCPTTRQKNGE